MESARGIKGRVERKVGAKVPKGTDATGGSPFVGFSERGVEFHPHRFHKKASLGPRGRDDGADVRQRESKGFFAKNGFPRAKSRDGELGMGVMRGSDVNGVDLRIPEEGLVRAVRYGNAPFLGKGGGFIAVPRGDGPKLASAGSSGFVPQSPGKCPGNAPRRDDSPANDVHSASFRGPRRVKTGEKSLPRSPFFGIL
jgi:hypothetical protein